MTSPMSCDLLLKIMTLLIKAVISLRENCSYNTSSTANLLWEGEPQKNTLYTLVLLQSLCNQLCSNSSACEEKKHHFINPL